jgi:glycosyltransferase involved in cell wall biosynthesis
MLAKLPSESDVEIINGTQQSTLNYLNQFIQQNNLTNCLTLQGYRKDFLNVMASLDIIVNCNRLGAFGRQAFETLALGVASIATCQKLGKSSVLNSDVALICKEGEKEQLYHATQTLIEDKNKRLALSVAAKKWGNEQFSPNIQSAKVYNIYKQILP